MTNIAALHLLSRNGFFDGLFSDFAEGKGQLGFTQRYENISRGSDEVLESYLSGDCKMTIGGRSNVSDLFGRSVRADLDKNLPKYKEFATKQLELIEPPSFLEKMMVINKTVANTKLGKIAGKATLGTLPAAMAVVALSARAYGASRHFVMDKLNLRQSDEKSFSKRLTEIKNREGYKSDLKKIKKLETLRKKSSVRSRLEEDGRWIRNDDLPKKVDDLQKISSDNRLLKHYMDDNWSINSEGKARPEGQKKVLLEDGVIYYDSSSYRVYKEIDKMNKTPLTPESMQQDIARHEKAVEMIEPPTKTELKLMRRLNRLKNAEETKSADSLILKIIDKSVERTMAAYMAQKQKQDKNFNGKRSVFARLTDIQKRTETQQRLNKMRSLEKKLKNNDR